MRKIHSLRCSVTTVRLTSTMEYLSFDVIGKTLSLKRKAIPNPRESEIVVKVSYAGICGTDLHILEGAFPCKTSGELTLGHEFVGTVEKIGIGVTSVQVGQRVAIDPNKGCNKCKYCHEGNYHFCDAGGIKDTIGIFRDGGWATHAVVPEVQVHLIPDGVAMDKAVLAEPLSCLAHGWDKVSPLNVGSKVLILGAGIIGLLWACVLHLHGHRKTVTVSEPQEKRRAMVSQLGVDYEAKTPAQLKEGYDLVVDCSGSGPAMEAAVPLLNRGGKLCVFGVASPNSKITIEPFQIYMKELSVIGVNINPFTFPKGLALLAAMADRYLDYKILGIQVFSLSQYREAMEALKKGAISKAVFKL